MAIKKLVSLLFSKLAMPHMSDCLNMFRLRVVPFGPHRHEPEEENMNALRLVCYMSVLLFVSPSETA